MMMVAGGPGGAPRVHLSPNFPNSVPRHGSLPNVNAGVNVQVITIYLFSSMLIMMVIIKCSILIKICDEMQHSRRSILEMRIRFRLSGLQASFTLARVTSWLGSVSDLVLFSSQIQNCHYYEK